MSKKKNTTSKTEEIKVKKDDEIKEKVKEEKQEIKNTEVKEERIEKEIKNTTIDNEKIHTKATKRKRSVILNFLILLVLISSLAYFIVSLLCFNSLGDVINGLLMVGISTFFVAACYTNPGRKKSTSCLALLGLFIYQVLGCLVSYGLITWPSNTIGSFVGKSLTDVVKWSTNNNIELIQEYEYSDSIKEYHVIYQDVLPDTKIKDINKLTIAISEGPSPYKEIVLPNMVGWDTSQVLEFVEENYLSNVYVEFVQGTVNENTLIEQSKSGNVKRNDEIKLVFSYGEERHYTEVKLGDLTNKSKFEAEFYLKQYGIKYEFDYDFSNDIKRGYVMKQDIPEGTMISISENPQTVKVTISKGPEIVVPDLKKMSVADITSWVIDNKLKIEFDDRYDDTALENEILDVNYEKDSVVEEGTVIKVTLSKGKLVMKNFESYAEFRE